MTDAKHTAGPWSFVEWLQDEASKREGKALRRTKVMHYLAAHILRRIANRLADGAPFMEKR